jgi:hypothetical protein
VCSSRQTAGCKKKTTTSSSLICTDDREEFRLHLCVFSENTLFAKQKLEKEAPKISQMRQHHDAQKLAA